MLESEYLHNIISNLGIAISPENNSEIIIKMNITYDKKSNVYVLSNEYKIFYQDYGTIISDFQNTNFSNKEHFIEFFNKYGLFGLEDKKMHLLFKNKQCDVAVYKNFIEKSFRKYKKMLIGFQKDIDSVFSYCLLTPPKNTSTLTPFERLCILEYLPGTPALLQDNMLQIIRLNTLSDIENPNCTESELIAKISNKACRAYTNFLYVPTTIASLINFELTEILKDNIILKTCNYCGKYFVATNRHITYCNNIAPNYTNKTCKQVARNNRHIQSQKEDEALALFLKIYNHKAYKASRYPDIIDYSLDYKHFQQVGRKKVNNYKSKKITKEEFINWLNRNK